MQLYTFEPKHENPLEYFRDALGDSKEKKNHFDILAGKIRVLEEQNDLLKTQNGELAKLQAILEKFSCEKMADDEEHHEPELKIVDDVEMRAADANPNGGVSPVKEEVDTENCDFSNVRNSTAQDADMNEFHDSLFNANIGNPKPVSIVPQLAGEPATEKLESPKVTAMVSVTFDATTTESEQASIPDDRVASNSPKSLPNITGPSPEATTATDISLSELITAENENGSMQDIERQSPSENASETFTCEEDTEIASEAASSVAEEPASDVYQLPTIIEESDVSPAAEDGTNIGPETPESIDDSQAIATKEEFEEQATPPINEVCQSPTAYGMSPTSDVATIGSECASIPNTACSSFDGTAITASEIDALDETVVETECESVPPNREDSSTVSAPEIVVTGASSDTLSADTDTASISQQSLTEDNYADSLITEIRTQIVETVLNNCDECDQPDSAVPFVDDSQAIASHQDTLDDIEKLICKEQEEQEDEQGEGARTERHLSALTIEIDEPQLAVETREPITSQFNPSQIVSLKYSESGSEILTLDVPVSNESSSTMIFDLDTSLPLSQSSSDVGEEGDYLLPPRQKIKETISPNSCGSPPILDDTTAGEEQNSNSSSNATATLSDTNVDMDTTITLSADDDQFDVPEKISKRKLSIADDVETEFLLSKSRKHWHK